MRLLTKAEISSEVHISSLYSIESFSLQYEIPTRLLMPLVQLLLSGWLIIGGGGTILSIATSSPLISSTFLLRKGIFPKVCFTPCIRHT